MKIPPHTLISAGLGLKPAPGPVELKKQDGPGQVAVDPEKAKLKQACQDFESIFLNFLLGKMRDTVPKSDLMGSSHGEDVYRGMLDDELAKQMAASGGVGLADTLYRQIEGTIPPGTPAGGEADENRRDTATTDIIGLPLEVGTGGRGGAGRTDG